mmetsp:Transcript_10415/g.23579  ORF Transcript_10415/g.23579 Transcript_10415/m.23579 type:complete len:593 (-) Transcript_10415:81-1859(-)
MVLNLQDVETPNLAVALLLAILCSILLPTWATSFILCREEWVSELRGVVAATRRLFDKIWFGEESDVLLHAKVESLMNDYRLRSSRRLLLALFLVVPLGLVCTVVQISVFLETEEGRLGTTSIWAVLVHGAGKATLPVVYLACCMVQWKPNLVCLTLIRCLYIFIVAELAIGWPFAEKEGAFLTWSLVVRVVASLCVMETLTVLPCNLLALAVALASSLLKSGEVSTTFGAHAVCTVLIVLSTALLEVSWRSKLRADLEATTAKSFECAAESLLHGMCDAVVRVDSELKVMGGSLQMASLLLQPVSSLHGASFPFFLQDEDERQEFTSFIKRSTNSVANTMNTVLRDSTQTRVQVQIFHARCRDVRAKDGNVHMLGIRDLSAPGCGGCADCDPLGAVWRSEDRELGTDASTGTGGSGPVAETIGASSTDSPSELSEEVNTRTCVYDAAASGTDACLWVELDSGHFRMRSCTPACVSICGSAAMKKNRSFLQAISHLDRERVRRAFFEAVSNFWNSQGPSETLINFSMNTGYGKRFVSASFSVDLQCREAGDIAKIRIEAMFKRRASSVHTMRPEASSRIQPQLSSADISLYL